jgi:hypothetical protein
MSGEVMMWVGFLSILGQAEQQRHVAPDGSEITMLKILSRR